MEIKQLERRLPLLEEKPTSSGGGPSEQVQEETEPLGRGEVPQFHAPKKQELENVPWELAFLAPCWHGHPPIKRSWASSGLLGPWLGGEGRELLVTNSSETWGVLHTDSLQIMARGAAEGAAKIGRL